MMNPNSRFDAMEFDDEDPEREATAYHEAGHCVLGVCLGATVRYATIHTESERLLGEVEIHWIGPQLPKYVVMAMMAGPVAESIFRDEPMSAILNGPGGQDWRQAWQQMRSWGWEEAKCIDRMRKILTELKRALQHPPVWSAVAAVADLLLAHETLEHEEIAYEVSQWMKDGLGFGG
ncbi:MAG: hypothetical protein WCI02_08255 [Planctomycetota bacterium]|jgi:hypothetical protein